MSILKIKDSSGIWQAIRTLKGDKGDHGDPVDVRINGQSIIDADTAVADIPIATYDKYGLTKPFSSSYYGLGLNEKGLYVYGATNTDISSRSGNGYRPITPATLDHAVKIALTDGRGADYTEAERKAVRDRTNTRAGKLFLISDDVLESDIRVLRYDFSGRNLKNIHIIFTSAPSQTSEMKFYGTPNGLSDVISMYSCTIPISGYLVLDFCTESGFIYCNHRYGTLNVNYNSERLRGMGFEQGDYIENIVFNGNNMDFKAGLRIQIWGC